MIYRTWNKYVKKKTFILWLMTLSQHNEGIA